MLEEGQRNEISIWNTTFNFFVMKRGKNIGVSWSTVFLMIRTGFSTWNFTWLYFNQA